MEAMGIYGDDNPVDLTPYERKNKIERAVNEMNEWSDEEKKNVKSFITKVFAVAMRQEDESSK